MAWAFGDFVSQPPSSQGASLSPMEVELEGLRGLGFGLGLDPPLQALVGLLRAGQEHVTVVRDGVGRPRCPC